MRSVFQQIQDDTQEMKRLFEEIRSRKRKAKIAIIVAALSALLNLSLFIYQLL